ncbi:hypothetical protein HYDPIDRAFT_171204 [Hydnomerulius pinastri MD-312]|uniref:Uncharacterized protein n=1 Tax=Hydnomerulius pinastri MD-312 TaxID=994086 RepID=A0A0C9VLZ2_9AGAM|nr:hypothetical protein HYDPIDRAFT_171204 [Hydnomerulius pinastri MD-312]
MNDSVVVLLSKTEATIGSPRAGGELKEEESALLDQRESRRYLGAGGASWLSRAGTWLIEEVQRCAVKTMQDSDLCDMASAQVNHRARGPVWCGVGHNLSEKSSVSHAPLPPASASAGGHPTPHLTPHSDKCAMPEGGFDESSHGFKSQQMESNLNITELLTKLATMHSSKMKDSTCTIAQWEVISTALKTSATVPEGLSVPALVQALFFICSQFHKLDINLGILHIWITTQPQYPLDSKLYNWLHETWHTCMLICSDINQQHSCTHLLMVAPGKLPNKEVVLKHNLPWPWVLGKKDRKLKDLSLDRKRVQTSD